MFEKAIREKFRFVTKRGNITMEDLWDLPLSSSNGINLDTVAKHINRELKSSEEESFVIATKSNDVLRSKLEIVKHIIKVKMTEADAKIEAITAKNNNDRINRLIADKKDEKLASLSIEELEKLRK